MKNSFIIYTEIWPVIQKLDMEQRGQLFTAIMKHALGEEPEKLDILVDVVFAFIKSQMDRADEKYQDVCRRRAEYGRRGGIAAAQAKATKSKQKRANQADSDSESDSERDNEPDSERESDSDSDGAIDAPVAALPPLSPKDEELLRSSAGDRADGLIADVRTYYETHLDKRFPGWPVALAQFDRNQQRWGKAETPKRKKTTEELAEQVFAELEAEGKL